MAKTVNDLYNAARNTASLGAGLCAGWITKVYGKIGLTIWGNACCMYWDTCNKDLSQLKEGMLVAVPQTKSSHGGPRSCGHYGYGHVGIYLHGQVWSSVTASGGGGKVIQESLQAFKARAYSGCTVKCGWVGGVELSGSTGTDTNANTGDYMQLVSGKTYRCNYTTLYVHSSPDTNASTRTGSLTVGDEIVMDSTTTKNGYLWGIYTANSGKTRYVAIKKQASSSTVPTSVPAGTYKCLCEVNIRKSASLSGAISGKVTKGGTRVMDGWSCTANGYVWGRFTNTNGYWRYMAVRSTNGNETLMEKIS